MTKFTQCHNSKNHWLCSKVKTGNLLVIPYQLTKFQAPSSNSFWDILLTSLKCPNLRRTITPAKIDRIFQKVNQVNYPSSPMSWPSSKPLAQIVFEISCWQVFEVPKFSKGHNSEKNDGIRLKVNQVIMILYQLTKSKPPRSNTFSRNLAAKIEMSKFAKGHNSEIFDRICSKVNQVIYLLSPISWQSFKLSSNSFWDILLTTLKCPNIQRAITQKNLPEFFQTINQVIYLSSPISWPSSKLLAGTVFEISCWQV